MRPRRATTADLFHKPVVLYRASTERREAAGAAYQRKDWVLAIYLAGLAVESILQAIALRDNPTHDAKHDLTKWLGRCGPGLLDKVKSQGIIEHWNHLYRVWRNELRYPSRDGLLGYLRDRDLHRGISGGPDALMRTSAKRLLDAATAIHNCGVAAWNRYAGK